MLTTKLGVSMQASNEVKMGELHSTSWISPGCSKLVYIIGRSGRSGSVISDNYLNYSVRYLMMVIQNLYTTSMTNIT